MNTLGFDNKSSQVKEEQETQVNSFVALLGLAGLVLFHQACAPSKQRTGMISLRKSTVHYTDFNWCRSNVILLLNLEVETINGRVFEDWKMLWD